MCTVTYIPKGNDTFYLTQSRDESIKRAIASPPIRKKINGIYHIFPVDPEGMGTWIGTSETGRTASLLNGGSSPYSHNPPYRHSRGLIIMDYFSYADYDEFISKYNFENLEPFTLLVFEYGKIFELIHNENGIQSNSLDPSKAFIYSSTTLYSEERIHDKKLNFLEWYFYNEELDQSMILDFHRNYLYENEEDKSILPEGVILKTVSITSLSMSSSSSKVDYFDLVNDIHLWNSQKIVSSISENLIG